MVPAIEKSTLSVKDQRYRNLLRYGLPTCIITLLLAYLGSDLMRLAVLMGSLLAYGVVARRRVYPFGYIAGADAPFEDKKSELLSGRLEEGKDTVRRVALVWVMVLLLVCGLSILVPLVHVNAIAGTDLFDNITKLSVVFSMVQTHIGDRYRPTAARYFVMVLRVIDNIILISISLFFSITGSACLFWFFIHREDIKRQQAQAS